MAENNTKRGPGHGPGGPRGGFRKPKDLRGTLSKLMGYLGRYKALLVIVVILLFISAACSVAGSYLIKPLINDYILPGDFIGLAKMLCVMAGVYVVGAVCSYGYAQDHGPCGPEHRGKAPGGPVQQNAEAAPEILRYSHPR